ncbi:MAG: DUF374 domain-containing protein [Rubripirellula sp.]
MKLPSRGIAGNGISEQRLTRSSTPPPYPKSQMLNRRRKSQLISYSVALAILILRLSCRIRLHGDPRKRLKEKKTRYVYAVLHAHQVAAIIDGEPGTGAMVSQSGDGEIIVPSLRIRGIVPVRGSGGRGQGKGRGGLAALEALIQHVVGGRPAYLAVDGPRGPRGHVQRGIVKLASQHPTVGHDQ